MLRGRFRHYRQPSYQKYYQRAECQVYARRSDRRQRKHAVLGLCSKFLEDLGPPVKGHTAIDREHFHIVQFEDLETIHEQMLE